MIRGFRKKFFVHVAGKTNGAHHELVDRIKQSGRDEVNDPDTCDYMLVFCPVASRVGTDVGETVENLPAHKDIVLVVMHHTHSPSAVIAESSRLVKKPNIFTVDCLFYEGNLLRCDLNNQTWKHIQRHLGISPSQDSLFWRFINCCWINRKWICGGLGLLAVFYLWHKPDLLPFLRNAEKPSENRTSINA